MKKVITIITVLASIITYKASAQSQPFFGSDIFNKDTNGLVKAPQTNDGSKMLLDSGWTNSSSLFWRAKGNTGINSLTDFLGTTDTNLLSLRSNNQQIFDLGQRKKLGLVQAQVDYTDSNQYIAYLRGAGGVSCLQFQADNANFYKPMFFTNSAGNFRLKGSAAGTDFFELGSTGTANAGGFEFVIGDDGDEPIAFKKYNYTTTANIELMRMQGTGLNTNVRVGVNVNGNLPNSTFQVVGSQSSSVLTTSTATVLNESHYIIILTANVTTTLPAANTCTGREYIIKKTATGTSVISTYITTTGASSVSINNGVTRLVSDGTNWQQIN